MGQGQAIFFHMVCGDNSRGATVAQDGDPWLSMGRSLEMKILFKCSCDVHHLKKILSLNDTSLPENSPDQFVVAGQGGRMTERSLRSGGCLSALERHDGFI